MDDREQLDRALTALLSTGPVEVFEDGALLAELTGMKFEVKQEGKHTVVHLWSSERNLVRRVLRISEHRDGRVSLEVSRFGRSRPGKLDFVAVENQRPESRLSREKFRARFRRLLAEQFPDDEVESLTVAPDLEHSFSGSYARGVLRRGGRGWAVMGVSSNEQAATVDAILTFGLLWLDWIRGRARRTAVAGLRLILPGGACQVTAHRLQAIVPSASVELYEMDEAERRIRPVDLKDFGNLATRLTPLHDIEHVLSAAGPVVEKIRQLDPDAIDAVVPPGSNDVAFRFHGLEFARWHGGQVQFGMPENKRMLSGTAWPKLRELVRLLARNRQPQTKNPNHPYYRSQGERWLETLLAAEPSRLDAHLDSKHLYSQVPAFSAGDRGVLDLLSVTRDGRLTVMELKVEEDPHLVVQAVDYWLRVRWHHREGDFARFGYFGGLELSRRPPQLYLVAPGLRFHPATDVILRYLIEEIEVTQIGLNETWRKGIQVVFRK